MPPAPKSAAPPSTRARPRSRIAGAARRLAVLVGRSLLPLVALSLILGTFLWGPWITLGLTFAWWTAVTRWA